ncbi:MAG: ferritin-like domain-containing protein [Solirubrobacteraceae bacterium]
MPDNGSLNTRDAKLIQWLNEAYAKEAELEVDLTAHIALTQKASYKKRLQQHLTETRDHKRRVASRIKKLGGDAVGGINLPGVPGAVGEAAGKAVSAVKGQVGAARAAVTAQPETHVRNAQEELREEHVEIALYSRITTLAEEVGDRETAQLAKAIRRDEERMAKFLDAELVRLVKELVRKEIPRDQRAGGTKTRRRTRRTSTTRSSSSRSTSASRRSNSGSRSAGSRKRTTTASKSRSTSGSRTKSRSGAGSRTTSRSSSRSGSSRSSGSRSRGTPSANGSSPTSARRTRARAGSRS